MRRHQTGYLAALGLLFVTLTGCMTEFEPPDADTEDGQAYVRRCSLCHALPNPSRMSFARWKVVVDRMEDNVRARNVPQMTADEKERILRYLSQHAKAIPQPGMAG